MHFQVHTCTVSSGLPFESQLVKIVDCNKFDIMIVCSKSLNLFLSLTINSSLFVSII